MAKKKPERLPGTINGQTLTYWMKRTKAKDPGTAKLARRSLQATARLSEPEKEGFGADVPALLKALTGSGSVSLSLARDCLLGLGASVLPHLPAHFRTVTKQSFSLSLANGLLDMARQNPASVSPVLIEYLWNVGWYSSADGPFGCLVVRAELGQAGAALAPHLEVAFGKGDIVGDWEIARTLGYIRAGVPTLVKALHHEHPQVRYNATESLKQIMDPVSIPHLIKALQDDDYRVVSESAVALGWFQALATDAIPALQKVLNSRSQAVRVAAERSLRLIGGEAAKPAAKVKVDSRMNKGDDVAARFVQAILDASDDDTPRLVYADWLEEHGNADRAEFIRLQCQAAQLEEWDPQRINLEQRAYALLEAHERE